MDVFITAWRRDASPVLEEIKSYFADRFPDMDLEWKRAGAMIRTSLSTDEETITAVFRELIGRYQDLEVEARYSFDIREDDRSAQWWETVRIYSEEEDGETRIFRSSDVYWN